MSQAGVRNCCKTNGRINGDLHTVILNEDVVDSISHFGKTPSDITFQQDNDTKHTCKKAKEWFKNHQIKLMSWLAQSPDLNPTEHLWEHLKRRLGEYPTPPGGILELWERVEKEWEAIPQSVCRDLVESMPRKVAAVIEAKGATQSTDNLMQLSSDASATKLFQCCLPNATSISRQILIVITSCVCPRKGEMHGFLVKLGSCISYEYL